MWQTIKSSAIPSQKVKPKESLHGRNFRFFLPSNFRSASVASPKVKRSSARSAAFRSKASTSMEEAMTSSSALGSSDAAEAYMVTLYSTISQKNPVPGPKLPQHAFRATLYCLEAILLTNAPAKKPGLVQLVHLALHVRLLEIRLGLRVREFRDFGECRSLDESRKI